MVELREVSGGVLALVLGDVIRVQVLGLGLVTVTISWRSVCGARRTRAIWHALPASEIAFPAGPGNSLSAGLGNSLPAGANPRR